MSLIRAIVIAGLASCAQASQASSNDEALALLHKAHDVTDIRSLGPLYLSATFKINKVYATYSGKYHLLWVNDQKWRDEVVMGNYVQVRIGSGDHVYQARNLPDLQNFADSVTNLVDVSRYLQPWPGETFVKLNVKKVKGANGEAKCVVFRDAEGVKYDAACIETGSGKPLNLSGETVRYSSYAAVSNKMFPTDIQSPTISLHVDLVTLTSNFPPTSFDPPAKPIVIDGTQETPSLVTRAERDSFSTVRPGCYSMIPAQVLKPVYAKYDAIADTARAFGTVVADLWVDQAGTSTIKQVTGIPIFAPGVKEAVMKQSYAPAQCGNRTVPSAIRLLYEFDLPDNNFIFCPGSRYSADAWCRDN